MSELTTTRTYDPLTVWAFITTPEIWETVAEDGQEPGEYRPNLTADCWLVMRVDGEVAALYHIHRLNQVLVQIHAQVLPKYRKEYSQATGEAALAWILANDAECEKIIAWVPTLYPNVKAFTESFGFRVEGRITYGYLKHGRLHDQWILGIKRGEI